MTIALVLLLALAPATAPQVQPGAERPSSERLSLDGVGIGDPEGRLITLMPTARCSDVEGDSGIADRWCRVPEQRVFGVLPRSLSATLRGDRIDTVIARVAARSWPLLRANLMQRLGAPDQQRVVAPPALREGADVVAAEGAESLLWRRDGAELQVQPAADGTTVLTLRPVAPLE